MSQLANVLFDSTRADAWAGTRAVAPAERSLLFVGGGLSVDCVLLPMGGGLCVAHGQVIDAGDEQPVRGASVRFDDGDAVATDAFGQFAVSALAPVAGRTVHVEAPGATLACRVPGPGDRR